MSARSALIHEDAAWADAPRGRLLLVSYHFPPAQTAGALRWEKLSAFAAERGWGIDVVTLHPDSLDLQDTTTLEQLPAPVRVFGVPEQPGALERSNLALRRVARSLRDARRRTRGPGPETPAGGAASKAAPARSLPRDAVRFAPGDPESWLRAYNNALRTARERAWALRAATVARKTFESGLHRLAIGCGPPNMTYEGTRRLARECGLPFVMDMRDPWSLVMRLNAPMASPLFFRIAEHYETRAVGEAGLVVVNNDLVGRQMQEKYPEAAGRILAIPNGCDEGIVPRSYTPDDPFRVAFAGSIYLDRNPASLFRALAQVVRELDLSPAQIEVAFMGSVEVVDGRPLEALAAAEGVEAYVRVLPRGTRREAERFLASAHVLLSLAQDSHVALPSKLFEYMRHEAALLVMAEAGSATHELVHDTTADLTAPDDVAAMAAALRRRYEEFRAGVRPGAIASDPRFSRRMQAERLFDALDGLCDASTTDTDGG